MHPWPSIAAGLAFVLLALPSAQAHADTAPEIRVVTEDFRPYNFEVMGEARGMSSEVVKAMLEHAGVEAEIDFYPWPRAYRYAQNHPNTLIYSIARIPEREALFEWIGVIAPYQTSIYKLRSRTDVEIRSLDDARKYRIGVSQADVIKTYLTGMGFENLEVARADEIALNMLTYERTDLVALDEAGFRFFAEEAEIAAQKIERILRIDDLSGELYVAMHPDSDPVLVQRLKDSLNALKENGDYEAIRSRYFGDP